MCIRPEGRSRIVSLLFDVEGTPRDAWNLPGCNLFENHCETCAFSSFDSGVTTDLECFHTSSLVEHFRAKFKAARHPGSALHLSPFNLPPLLNAHTSEHLRLPSQGPAGHHQRRVIWPCFCHHGLVTLLVLLFPDSRLSCFCTSPLMSPRQDSLN